MNAGFDPRPDNELGRGVLDPAFEAWLLSRGAVFARTVKGASGKPIVEFSCRPFVEAVADAAKDASKRQISLPVSTTQLSTPAVPA